MRPRIVFAEGADVGTWRHHLFGVLGPKIDNAFQNALLVFRALCVVGQFKRLLQVLHTHLGGRSFELVVHPASHADQRRPRGLQDALKPGQGPRGEFGQFHPEGGGVDFGNHFPKQHQQEGHTHHVNEGVQPSGKGVAGEEVLREDRGDEHDADVDQIVDHQDGAQQVARAFGVVGGAHQGEHPSRARAVVLVEVVQGGRRQREKRHLRTRHHG